MASYKSHRPRHPSLSNPAMFQQQAPPPRSTHSARSSASQASTSSSLYAQQLPSTMEQDRNYTPAPMPSPTINDQPCFAAASLGRQTAQKNALLEAQRQAQLFQQQQVSQQQSQQMMPSQLSAQQYQELVQIQQQQAQHYADLQRALQQQQQYAQMNNGGGYAYNPDLYDGCLAPDETDSYVNQLGLVAEAAKRAQMAVLERDLGGVDLS